MQNSQYSTPATDILRLTLSSVGVVVCLIACIWVWQMLKGQQALWPLPALYLLELMAVSIVGWLGINRRGLQTTPWVTILPWGAIGIFVGFAIMGAMSIGFLYLPVVLLFVPAALLSDPRFDSVKVAQLGACALMVLTQATLMLVLIQL
jgi:hypothetical protein